MPASPQPDERAILPPPLPLPRGDSFILTGTLDAARELKKMGSGVVVPMHSKTTSYATGPSFADGGSLRELKPSFADGGSSTELVRSLVPAHLKQERPGPPLFLRTELLPMVKLLTEAANAQRTVTHKKKLLQTLKRVVINVKGSLLAMRDELIERFKALETISDDQSEVLCTYVDTFGRCIADLSEVAASLSHAVRADFIRVQEGRLRHAINEVFKKNSVVSDPELMAEHRKLLLLEGTVAHLAHSWRAFFAWSLQMFRNIYEQCRDNPKPMTTFFETELAPLLLQEASKGIAPNFGALDTLMRKVGSHAPTGVFENARLCMRLSEYVDKCEPSMLLPPTMAKSPSVELERLFGRTAFEFKSAHAEWWKLWQTARPGAGLSSERSSIITELLLLCWMHLGISTLEKTEAVDWQNAYLMHVTNAQCMFNTYAEFVSGALELSSEIQAEIKVGATDISMLFKVHPSHFDDAMKAYIGFYKKRRLLRSKFSEKGPTYRDICRELNNTVLSKLTFFVVSSSQPLNDRIHADADPDVVHIDAVRVGRDLLSSYYALEFQPTTVGEHGVDDPANQLAEWQAVAQMIDMAYHITCNDRPVDGCASWLPRINALSMTISIFAHFSHEKAKKLAGGINPDMPKHFERLVKLVESVLKPAYKTESDFKKQLSRLSVHVEFNMSMPSIPVEDALQLYKDNMLRHRAMLFEPYDDAQNISLHTAYRLYDAEFQALEKMYLIGGPHVVEMVGGIFEYAKDKCFGGDVSKDWGSDDFRAKLPVLLAKIAFVFSLMRSNLISGDMVEEVGEMGAVRPHCIQILGILGLLGRTVVTGTRGLFARSSSSGLRNHIAEVLTGQGKSWVLMLLAVCFATTGKDVVIVCHNADLVKRDRDDAVAFLELLKRVAEPPPPPDDKADKGRGKMPAVKKYSLGDVRYQTYREMCWSMLESTAKTANKTVGPLGIEGLIADAIANPKAAEEEAYEKMDSYQLGMESKTVLLIDEVDVLFGELYGTSINPVSLVASKECGDLQSKMWDAKAPLDELTTKAVLTGLEGGDADIELHNSQMFAGHLEKMADGLRTVMADKSVPPDCAFCIGTDKDGPEKKGFVLYKHVEHGIEMFDKSIILGYQNAFQYLRLCQEGFGEKGRSCEFKYGYLNVPLGKLSYAELPKKFSAIFGVTGSLGVLPPKQLSVLKEFYDVSQFSYFPSFWGHRQLAWAENDLTKDTMENHFQVAQGWPEAFEQAMAQIKEVVRLERSVLVFVRDSEMLNKFYDHAKASFGKIHKLDSTEGERKDKETIIYRSAGEPKAITFATATYGRGEDFKYRPSVLEKGGGHAIQLFLSVNKADEVQIRGRVARKNEPGSYALILNWADVRERVNPTKADELKLSAASMSASQLYKRIDELRNAACSEGFAQQCTKAESFRDAHNQTFELLENTRKYYLRKLPRHKLLSMLHEVADKHCGSGSVDLAFLMDCTGSMASWIEVAKTQLFKIVENTKAKLGVKMRVAYVGYRDFDCSDKDRYDFKDFVEEKDMADLHKFIARSNAMGGGDGPEDVAGGLKMALSLTWKGDTRIIIHIADAPAHGSEYNGGMGDNYPGHQDPDPCDMLKKLTHGFKCHFFFFKMNTSTDAMTEKFRKTAHGSGQKFDVCDLAGDTSLFLDNVTMSVEQALGAARI